MKLYHRMILLFGATATCILCGSPQLRTIAEEAQYGFENVLNLAGLDREALATLSTNGDYDTDDWQLLAQGVYRLQQFPPSQLRGWATPVGPAIWSENAEEYLGRLLEISAFVESVESVVPPQNLGAETVLPTLYSCRFRLADGSASGIVLAPSVPSDWLRRNISEEVVTFFGIGLGVVDDDAHTGLVLTDHLAWFPKVGVSSGRLLLSNQGMDVALLDEVRQRQPFVKPEVSREGEAFYQCLAALAGADRQELKSATEQNVAAFAEQWQEKQPTLEKRRTELRRKLAASQDSIERRALEQELETVRRDLALAAAIEKQAKRKLSSVAPLFLQPEEEVGELVRIEGLARRAVRIAIPSEIAPQASLGDTRLDAYYEMEVFTSDSQNLPVVCCVSSLPVGFPVGDKIREPVLVDGVFFKSWRYRSRKNLASPGETGPQQRLYTPVVVGRAPTWLPATTSGPSRWGIWGGTAFIAALVVVWVAMICVAKRDQRRRAATLPASLDDLSDNLDST